MSKLLTSAQLSGRPGYPSEWTLSRWRRVGMGPPYTRIGGRVMYALADVEAWEKSNRVEGQPVAVQGQNSDTILAEVVACEQATAAGLLTSGQIAKLPGFPSASILSNLRYAHSSFPCVRMGRRYFYDPSEVSRWLSAREERQCLRAAKTAALNAPR